VTDTSHINTRSILKNIIKHQNRKTNKQKIPKLLTNGLTAIHCYKFPSEMMTFAVQSKV